MRGVGTHLFNGEEVLQQRDKDLLLTYQDTSQSFAIGGGKCKVDAVLGQLWKSTAMRHPRLALPRHFVSEARESSLNPLGIEEQEGGNWDREAKSQHR